MEALGEQRGEDGLADSGQGGEDRHVVLPAGLSRAVIQRVPGVASGVRRGSYAGVWGLGSGSEERKSAIWISEPLAFRGVGVYGRSAATVNEGTMTGDGRYARMDLRIRNLP